jgi:hypothetical protein
MKDYHDGAHLSIPVTLPFLPTKVAAAELASTHNRDPDFQST